MGWHLCPLCSPSGWVLTWLKKGMEKVVPQPVLSGLEGPAQVLQGLGAEGRWGRGGRRSAPGLSAHVCPSVCLSQQAGAEILGHCSPGDSGTSRRQDAFTGLGPRGGGVGPYPVPGETSHLTGPRVQT